MEDGLEGVLGDSHDGDVEDRHDRTEDDDTGDEQHVLVEFGVRRLGGFGVVIVVGPSQSGRRGFGD